MRGERCSVSWVALLISMVLTASAIGAEQPSAESASPQGGQISFTGKVFDSQEKPVADANVVFYQVGYDASGSFSTTTRVRNVITGSDGAFAFTAPKEQDGYRQGSIIAHKEGLALGWAVWNMHQGNQQSDIKLGEPKELSGVVVDEGDGPVGDAEVSLALGIMGTGQDRRYLTSLAAARLLMVRTDGAGRFVFPNLPAGATFELLAKKAGRATVCSFNADVYRGEGCQFSPGQAGIKMVLPAEARLEGKVVEKAGGKPVGGVQLVAQPARRNLPLATEPATSASDGSFSIGNLAPGGYTVQLPPRQTMADWVAEPVKVTLKAGETIRDVQFALSKGGFLEVLVKEDKSGKPIEKASVSIRDEAQDRWTSGATDANGIARIRLAPGDYQLGSVYKQEYARAEQEDTPFTIAEGQTVRMERTLGELPTVSGVVYDDSGKPLEGATVQVLPGGRGKNAVSDAEGKFSMNWDAQGWSSGQDMVFYVVARHLERGLAVGLPIDEEKGQMDVKLRPATTLAGQVVDPNGKCIPGAMLTIMFRASRWGASFLPHGSIRTDDEGRFEVPALPADQRYDVTASADGYGQERVEVVEEQTPAGKAQVSTFTLPVANLSVTGTVVDSQGKPVSGAQVSCNGGYEDNQPNRDTRTDAEGRFTLDRVCSGRINISAYTQGGGTNLNGYIQTEGGASDVQIVVAERSSSRVYVPKKPASLKGKPLPDLKKLGIELPADANDRMLLVCFWDMNQRPSRYCISELIRRAAQLGEKGVAVVAVQAGQIEQAALDQWMQQSKPPFPVCCVKDKIDQTQFEWGVVSLPHLILTDKKHLVVGEGFAMLGELDKRIEEASGQ